MLFYVFYTKVILKRSEVDTHTHRKGQYVVLSMDKRNIKVCFNFMAIVTIAIVLSWKGNFVEKYYLASHLDIYMYL